MQEIIELFERALRASQHDPRFILSGVCIFFVGVFNAWLDRLDNVGAFSTSIFSKWRRDFWLKPESANRKYKTHATGKIVVDYYDKHNKPVFKPAFKFLGLRSDKALVFLTDGWHLVQFAQWSFVSFAVVFAYGFTWNEWRFWAFWVVTRGLLTSSFSAFYDSIFRGRR